jgi:putative phosphoesterase
MLIGVMADTHDNLPKVAAATELFAARGVQAILHAGDFVAPFALKLLLTAGLPVTGVFGDNDGERTGLRKACPDLYSAPHRFEMGGRTVVLAHDPAQLAGEAAAGADLLVHGHTHKSEVRPGPPLLVNPGEAGGWLTGVSTVALVDLDSLTAELVELGSQETVR